MMGLQNHGAENGREGEGKAPVREECQLANGERLTELGN
jgi:hypothetical protein